MKKNILSFILVLGAISLTNAQTTEFDAIKFAQTDISGTARYMGMAGAFGALGGDVSAIKDNPAGLGVYRSWEMTTTFNFLSQKSNSKWEGQNASDDLFKFGFNNVALVMSFPTWNSQTGSSKGLLQSNWGFSYNRLKNFNRNVSIRNNGLEASIATYFADYTQEGGWSEGDFGYEDDYDYLPWMSKLAYEGRLINDENNEWKSVTEGKLVVPRYYLQESGYLDEYSISWGGNFNNKLYIGAAVNFHSVNYSMRSQYIEEFGNNESLDLLNKLQVNGLGLSIDAGLIYRPFDFLRLGFSYKTPMKYTLSDVNSGDMLSYIVVNNTLGEYGDYTGEFEYNYDVQIPGKLTASAAYIIGKKAIISTDFVYTNYRNIKLYDRHDGAQYYEEDNDVIKNTFDNGITVKVGAEYRLTDHLFLRAGFAAETASMKSSATKAPHLNTARTDAEYFRHKGTSYFTAGLGYRGNYWYFDAAFVNKNLQEEFMPYNLAYVSPAKVATHNYDVVATIGFKF